jgi:aromatase
MSESHVLRATHEAVLPASSDFLYGLVADAATAPLVFPGTVHVEQLDRTDTEERLRIWAADGDKARTWTSHRVLDPAHLRVTFRQEAPAPPIALMRGEWRFEPSTDGQTRVRLDHAYRAVADSPEGTSWIASMVDGVSDGQLAALGRLAALTDGDPGWKPLTFQDSAAVCCPAESACALAWDAISWAGLAPVRGPVTVHVAAPDMQLVDMTVLGVGGQPRPSRLARVRVPGPPLVAPFKEMRVPPSVAAHVGIWRFEPLPHGARVVIEHRVVADRRTPAHQDALAFARQAVGAVSRAALARLATLPAEVTL